MPQQEHVLSGYKVLDFTQYIAGPTVELLNQFDTGEIETTVRTLRAITQRAAERLAASGR